MDVISIACLTSIIAVGLFVNSLAQVFLVRRNSLKTMKDRILLILCVVNSLQSVGFAMELSAAITGK